MVLVATSALCQFISYQLAPSLLLPSPLRPAAGWPLTVFPRWAQSLPLTPHNCLLDGLRLYEDLGVSEGNNSKENAKRIPGAAGFKAPP